jgi:hypothetical protein
MADGEDVSGDIRDRLVRLEGKVDRIRDAVDYGDRASAQLVQLLAGRTDSIEKDVTTVAQLLREEIREVRMLVERQSDRIDAEHERTEFLYRWRAGVLAVGAAFGAVFGVFGGVIVKAFGGS